MSASTGITITGLQKSFRGHRVLHSVDVDARPGQVTGFLGPNGSGKSTTLHCLLGLNHFEAGEALVEGRRYRELDHPTSAVGAALDSRTTDPAMSGRNHLRVYATMGGHPLERVDACIEQLDMQAYAHRPTGTWSTGMRQRLCLATALLGDPRVVILDEPTNGLDPDGISWLRELLRSLADQGKTVLVSSHVLAEIEDVLDAAIILRDGRTVASGTLDELAQRAGVRSLEAIYAATRSHR